jgi:hypothetical protein
MYTVLSFPHAAPDKDVEDLGATARLRLHQELHLPMEVNLPHRPREENVDLGVR